MRLKPLFFCNAGCYTQAICVYSCLPDRRQSNERLLLKGHAEKTASSGVGGSTLVRIQRHSIVDRCTNIACVGIVICQFLFRSVCWVEQKKLAVCTQLKMVLSFHLHEDSSYLPCALLPNIPRKLLSIGCSQGCQSESISLYMKTDSLSCQQGP